MAVCGHGLGTSLVLKMNLESIAKQLGLDVQIELSDYGSCKSADADIYIFTSQDMYGEFVSERGFEDRCICIRDVMDEDILKRELKKKIVERNS